MGFCECLGKTGLTIVNVLLLAIAIICIACGSYGFATGLYKESNTMMGVLIGLIVLGIIIFITAVVGWVGICQNKASAITCYLVFVVICLILSAALAGFFTWVYVTYKNDPNYVLETAWNNTPSDIRQQFEKANNCAGYNAIPGSTLPPCGPILLDIYNRVATIALAVIWAVFGVILLTTIVACLVRNDITNDKLKAANAPQTVYQADPAYKV